MRLLIDTIQNKMEKILPTKRYYHTLGVAYLAASLAMCHGANQEQAMLAGLLHDCAKCLPDDEILSECKKNKISITKIEENNVFLLHAKLGAHYAVSKYGIHDSEILSAIQYHTTGRPKMTLLEKIIFLADYIELRRTQPTHPSLNEIRRKAFFELDLAVYDVLENTIRYLNSKGEEFDQTSKEAYEFYKAQLNKV